MQERKAVLRGRRVRAWAFHVGSPRHHRMSQLLHLNAGPSSENFGIIAKPVEVHS